MPFFIMFLKHIFNNSEFVFIRFAQSFFIFTFLQYFSDKLLHLLAKLFIGVIYFDF